MTKYHATSEGQIAFTSEEEAEWDAREKAGREYSGPDYAKEAEVRSERDQLLSETDWMACSDVTMSDTWKTYRQALRDVPSQKEFPNSVTWPTKPS